ncbi:MAG: hypothetical protein KIS66_09510 [Fimbriimonadaceae bacterium]|nr:hypothetical protein [Fimbriimonadaceae bacterium]
MLASFLLAASLAGLQPKTVSLVPTDDFWIYSFASDTKEPYLRAWGNGGKSVALPGDELEAFSYSYLRFDLAALPKNARIAKATLTLFQASGFGYGAKDAETTPLEVRFVDAKLDEKTWDYGKFAQLKPKAGPEGLLGVGKMDAFSANDKPVAIRIDLLAGKGGFAKILGDKLASGDSVLAVVLTSAFDPSANGRDFIYKVFSKDAPEAALRPTLVLEIE